MIRKMVTGMVLALATGVAMAGQVNLNSANAEQLDSALNGVGEVRAQAIVDYRQSNGEFDRVGDITAVKGIGDATLAENRDLMTVDAQD